MPGLLVSDWTRRGVVWCGGGGGGGGGSFIPTSQRLLTDTCTPASTPAPPPPLTDSGNLALQPFTGKWGYVGKLVGIPESYINNNSVYPLEGLPQRTRVGYIPKVPVLYMCGNEEAVDKCDDRMKTESGKLVENFSFHVSTVAVMT